MRPLWPAHRDQARNARVQSPNTLDYLPYTSVLGSYLIQGYGVRTRRVVLEIGPRHEGRLMSWYNATGRLSASHRKSLQRLRHGDFGYSTKRARPDFGIRFEALVALEALQDTVRGV